MTAEDLVHQLRGRGVELRADGGRILFRPADRVPEEIRAELRRRKAEIVDLLRRPPIVTLPELGPDERAALYLEDADGVSTKQARTLGECPACRRSRWWRSVHGSIVCARCHPPAVPRLVAEWLVAEGGAFDA